MNYTCDMWRQNITVSDEWKLWHCCVPNTYIMIFSRCILCTLYILIKVPTYTERGKRKYTKDEQNIIHALGITICVLFVSGSHSRRLAIFCNYYTLARRSGFWLVVVIACYKNYFNAYTHIIMVYRYAIIKCTLWISLAV